MKNKVIPSTLRIQQLVVAAKSKVIVYNSSDEGADCVSCKISIAELLNPVIGIFGLKIRPKCILSKRFNRKQKS